MNKRLSTLAICLGINAMATAQTKTLPYVTGFEDPTPVPDWQLIRKGGASDPHYVWKTDNTIRFEGSLSLYHGYPVGSSDLTDDWYVSPAFSLVDGGKIDSVRHHFTGLGVPGAGDTVAFYLLKDNPDPALASAKILLHDFRDTKYKKDFTWYQTKGIAIPATTGKAYIAFRYHTINNWLDVRFDNLGISANKPSSIASLYKAGADFTVSPIPAVNILNINTEIAFQWMELYDVAGRMIKREAFRPGMDLSGIPAGRYTLVLADEQQQKGIVSIIKQ
ncbi:MAG: choice-of-anchor J domain-containing protein [Chitinophagaceae bacterium]|nr:choice-of-anchor J domain-containing protein [Chitinophagaceae bacterium]